MAAAIPADSAVSVNPSGALLYSQSPPRPPSVVPSIPPHKLLKPTNQRRVRQLNARLDPTYNQPVSQIALYKAWLGKRRKEAFASSPLAGYVSAQMAAHQRSQQQQQTATAVTGALPAHSAILGGVRRVSIRSVEHSAPFLPVNASQAKEQTARKPSDSSQHYGSDSYDAAHRQTIEHLLSSRARQLHPDYGGGARAVQYGGGASPRRPFYPSHPSEAKQAIQIDYYLYSPDESKKRQIKQSTQERALVNSRLFRSRFMADEYSHHNHNPNDPATASAASASSAGDTELAHENGGGDDNHAYTDDDDDNDNDGTRSGDDDVPNGSGDTRMRRHRQSREHIHIHDSGAQTARLPVTPATNAMATATATATGSSTKSTPHKYLAFPRPATSHLSRGGVSPERYPMTAASLAATANASGQLPKHLLSPAELARFSNAPKFSSHLHTTYYPTIHSRPGSNRSSMADLLGDPALAMAGLSEDKSKFVKNKSGEFVPDTDNSAARKPKLPSFRGDTKSAAGIAAANAAAAAARRRNTSAPLILHRKNSQFGHGHDPKPPPPIQRVSLLRHYFAE